MKVFIVGAGKAGIYLAEKLRFEHDLTLIEQRPDRAAHLAARVPGVKVVRGDGCEPKVLERAGVADADLVAALTGDDEDNLVVSFLCKTSFGVPLVFARTNHPDNEWLFTREWGVDVAVSTGNLIASLIETQVSFGDIIEILRLRAGEMVIEQITLPEDAGSVGRRIADLGLPPSTRIVSITSGGRMVAPRGDTVLGVGDELLMVSESGAEQELRRAFGVEHTPPS
jgi:trk system potassium uptake protein TrkA